jgi:hypothetical protein
MATDKAYAIDYSQGDSLYVHGDTLIMKTDSIYRDVKAFYNVRFYRSDFRVYVTRCTMPQPTPYSI